MGLFGKKEKYEKGGIVRGSLQATKGVLEYSAGSAKKASGDSSGEKLQYMGAKDVSKGIKKMIGLKVKKD